MKHTEFFQYFWIVLMCTQIGQAVDIRWLCQRWSPEKNPRRKSVLLWCWSAGHDYVFRLLLGGRTDTKRQLWVPVGFMQDLIGCSLAMAAWLNLVDECSVCCLCISSIHLYTLSEFPLGTILSLFSAHANQTKNGNCHTSASSHVPDTGVFYAFELT